MVDARVLLVHQGWRPKLVWRPTPVKMELIVICVVALVTSLLTFFSGFGLGTMLTPVFAIYFPVEVAIALTGVVHFLNNLFKLVLVGGHADKETVLKFGVPAYFAALAGAYFLIRISWYLCFNTPSEINSLLSLL